MTCMLTHTKPKRSRIILLFFLQGRDGKDGPELSSIQQLINTSAALIVEQG